jgi:hypothetical protein
LATTAIRPSRCRTVRGRKAKGRRACLDVQQAILQYYPSLSAEDVYVKTGSAGGVDLHFSAKGRKVFPFAVEVKGAESLNIWAALSQALANADDRTPIVFFKRSHSPLYVALSAVDFLATVSPVSK